MSAYITLSNKNAKQMRKPLNVDEKVITQFASWLTSQIWRILAFLPYNQIFEFSRFKVFAD